MTNGSSGAHRIGLKVYGRLTPRMRQILVRSFGPSYTVGTMTVVTRDDGAILLVRLSYIDRWSLPGGLLDRHELPADGAIRETLEEAGVPIDLVGEPAVVVDPDYQVVRVIYRARLPHGVEASDAHPASLEIVEVGWFTPDEFLGRVSPETGDAYAALVRAERGGPADGR